MNDEIIRVDQGKFGKINILKPRKEPTLESQRQFEEFIINLLIKDMKAKQKAAQ